MFAWLGRMLRTLHSNHSCRLRTFVSSSSSQRTMRVAIEGCAHGELDKIYETIHYLEQKEGVHVDLLLICGDFQSVRNEDDLESLACPIKYRSMNSFYKYYSGECTAPVPTIFVGGNHEASNYLFELYHGGWVAPNIYFLGNSGVVNFGGLRIAGLSGIFKSHHYNAGFFEQFPLNGNDMRSIYHVRLFEIFKLMQVSGNIDIFLSHDWPRGIAYHGDTAELLRRKSFLAEEIQSGSLGNPETEHLLKKLQPSYWFAAHLHVKFAAIVNHEEGKSTKFLSLDKCLPRRDFLQIVEFPDANGPLELSYDPEWLAITRSTYEHMSLNRTQPKLPLSKMSNDPSKRVDFSPTEAELAFVKERFGDLKVPQNFERTVRVFDPSAPQRGTAPELKSNPQTEVLLNRLELEDLFAAKRRSVPVLAAPNPEEIDLDLDVDLGDDDDDNTNPEEIYLDNE